MIYQKQSQKLIDFLKKPVLTEKTTQFLEYQQYTFEVDVKLTKTQIKYIFEYYYGQKIQSIKTHRVHSSTRPKKRVRLHFVDPISFLSK
uniref:Large ribosomal subunit protein uL23c n=1 Tax=Rhipilia penicilloides TaxID=1979422 RepID=A0A2P0QHT1_9CHLO|nr:ribosomal protein L23 [Rhipilia penicilloides]ARO74306.1 ribosomal protein L23 [Rhipilia penicilloides]